MKIRSVVFVFTLVSLCANRMLATTYTWTGKAPAPNNQLWSNVQNWSPSNSVPGAADTAIIPTVAGSGFVVTLDVPVTVANLSAVSAIISMANPLTVNNSLQLQYVFFNGGGSLTVNGSMTVDIVNFVDSGTTFQCPTLLNGQTTVRSNATVFVGSGSTMVNAGVFTLASTAALDLGNSSTALFVNQGGFLGGNSVVSTASSVFSNAPASSITAKAGGKLQFQGKLVNNGYFTPEGNGLVYISATTTLHDGGKFLGNGSGITELTGTVTLDGLTTVGGQLWLGDVSAAPTLTLNGNLEVLSGGNLTWFGGNLQGVGTNVTGTITIDGGGDMLINQSTFMNIRNIVITNQGNIDCTNQGNIFMGYNARIDNSGYFNFWSDGGLLPLTSGAPGYNVATFDNHLRLEKHLGATNSASIVGIPVNGGGALWIYNGILELQAGGVIDDVFNATTLKLSGGTFTVASDTSFLAPIPSSGYGTVYLKSAGILNLNHQLVLTGGELFEEDNGGQLIGSNTFKIKRDSTFNWAGGTIALSNNAAIFNAYSFDIIGAGNIKHFKSGTLQNYGYVYWKNDNNAGGIEAGDGVVFFNSAGAAFNCECDSSIIDVSSTTPPYFTNQAGGLLEKRNSGGTTYFGIRFINLGLLEPTTGTIEIPSYDDTQAPFAPAAELRLNHGTIKIDNAVTYHANISGSGQLSGNHGTTVAGDLSADLVTVVGDLSNDGNVILGDAPGIVSYVAGNNYFQTTNGRLVVPIRGTNAVTPDFGQLKLNTQFGQVNLAGTLEADITEGYAPPIGASFPFIISSQRNGTFNQVKLPPGLTLNYTPGGATLVVTGAVPVQIISPAVTNGQFQFGFNTISNRSYTVQYKDNLAAGPWIFLTNFTGNGLYWQPPPLSPLVAQRFYRVSNP